MAGNGDGEAPDMRREKARVVQKMRWNVTVSKETDRDVRAFLAHSGAKTGDLSRLVEDAVQWRLMKLNIGEARARNALLSEEEIEAAVGQAVAQTRAGSP